MRSFRAAFMCGAKVPPAPLNNDYKLRVSFRVVTTTSDIGDCRASSKFIMDFCTMFSAANRAIEATKLVIY